VAWVDAKQIREMGVDAEQVIRGYIEAINAHDEAKVASYLTDDFVENFANAPSLGRQQYVEHMKDFFQAFSDFNYYVENVSVDSNQVSVNMRVSGTHDGPLPGTPPIPPTGNNFSVPDKLIVTLRGDRLAELRLESPANGGPGEALKQLGLHSS